MAELLKTFKCQHAGRQQQQGFKQTEIAPWICLPPATDFYSSLDLFCIHRAR